MRYPTSLKSTNSNCENLTNNNIANNSNNRNKESNRTYNTIELYKETTYT